jgi:hypothetical protein
MLSIRAPFKRTPEVSDAGAEGAVDDAETKVERLRRELAAAELAERRKINRLRRELANAEANEKSAVSSETTAPRPGKAGLLTVAQLVDLGLILEESVRRNRELPQKELAKLLGYKNPQGLNNHIARLEAKLEGQLFVPNETNRSGRLTFEGWEFGMIGVLLRDLVELDGAVPQRVYEKVLRELVYRLRWSKMEALDNVDPDEDLNAPRLSGLAAMAVGVKGFHWLETIVPVEPETRVPLPEVPKSLPRPKPSSSVSARKDPFSRDRG